MRDGVCDNNRIQIHVRVLSFRTYPIQSTGKSEGRPTQRNGGIGCMEGDIKRRSKGLKRRRRDCGQQRLKTEELASRTAHVLHVLNTRTHTDTHTHTHIFIYL